MTDTQPEALRLADELDAVPETGADPQMIQEAAAELRRLHAEVELLRKMVPDVEFAREAIYGKAEGREA